jgi:uncharacterized membrane protein YoaT (DUF817 family)
VSTLLCEIEKTKAIKLKIIKLIGNKYILKYDFIGILAMPTKIILIIMKIDVCTI